MIPTLPPIPSVKYRIAAAVFSVLLLTACSSKPAAESAGEKPATAPPAAEITPDEVVVTDVKLLRGADGKGYRVEGQVHNTSAKAALAEFELQLVMQDCLEDYSCKILGRDVTTIPAKVAPGQAVPFEYEPNLKDMPPAQGHLGYRYEIIAARSDSASEAGNAAKP